MPRPRIVYFDMGNVLLLFDHRKAARQMAAAAGIDEQTAWQIVFEDGLEHEFESGLVDAQGFYDRFCQRAGKQPDYEALRHASADIFEVNVSILPLVAGLLSCAQRVGILSNTNENHWDHVTRHYAMVAESFDVHALSFELRSMKPDRQAYDAAAELAGVSAGEIFFVDDRQENVDAAQAAGFDAVRYTSTRQLALDLLERGVPINY